MYHFYSAAIDNKIMKYNSHVTQAHKLLA